VGRICHDDQISRAQYYQWRDQFLAHAPKAFEVAQQTEREARLHQENVRLKKLVGELALELNKATMRGGDDPTPLGDCGPTERADCPADPGPEGRVSLLGLPADLGGVAVCGRVADQQEVRLAADAHPWAAGQAERPAESHADAGLPQATPHRAAAMVGAST
jgi:hypothetical protein